MIALNHCPPSSHQRSLTIAEDLCRKKKSKKAMPYLAKAMEDPNNLDADIQYCFLQPNLEMSMQVLEDAERKGMRAISTRSNTTYLLLRSCSSD